MFFLPNLKILILLWLYEHYIKVYHILRTLYLHFLYRYYISVLMHHNIILFLSIFGTIFYGFQCTVQQTFNVAY